MFYFKKKIFIFFLVLFIIPNQSKTDENLINTLKKGKNIIFIRHSLAPGNGDPAGFILSDCSTQRNLNKKGIIQSKKIGKFFEKNKIPIDLVLSSEWCRCKDTAFYAFSDFKTFDALNSFYDEKFAANEDKQINNLKKFIKKWKGDKNLVLVTHYVVINSILGVGSGSGEIVVADKNLILQGRISDY